MCRLLCVKSENPVSMEYHLTQFAEVARNSPEDQSHGWGCAWFESGTWRLYHNIAPIWEDSFHRFSASCYFIAHARSAFRNEGIAVENNMPFFDGSKVFAFNGELLGVRIRESGRIGAEKVFNFINRFDVGDTFSAIETGCAKLVQKSRYTRAMNMIVASGENAWVHTLFNENADYFQLHEKREESSYVVCSSPYENDSGWQPIVNKSIFRLP